MRESLIENHLRKCARAAKGRAYKWKSPGRKNVPDRLVILPKVPAFAVELKATDVPASDAQLREHDRLRALGMEVYVIDSKVEAEELIKQKARQRRGK